MRLRSPFVPLVCLLILASPLCAQKEREIPKKKQTTLGLYVTAREAHAMWKADPKGHLVLDVRTPEEYVFVGHAPMARNIPLAFMLYHMSPGAKHPAMRRNPDFVKLVKAAARPDQTLIVMCRSGVRSAKSVDLLAKAGFKKVYTVIDGFEGDKVKDPKSPDFGKRTLNGWRNSGLPWTYDLDPKLMYLVE